MPGAVPHAIEWLRGMQCRNGGFAAFDVDNTYYYLNEIPFADHGALLDPPTEDVTARVVTLLARAGRSEDRAAIERAMAYLRLEQKPEGGWFGRWGSNYTYGTWSVLTAFGQVGVPRERSGGGARRAMARALPASRRRLGREQRQLRAAGAGGSRSSHHALPYRLGAARADGRSLRPRRRAPSRHRLSAAHSASRWSLERSVLQCPGVSARVLPALPRLRRLFPAMGAGALSAPQAARIIGVIAALSSEARCLGRSRRRADESVRLDDGTLVRVSGIGPEAAEEAAEALVRSGATALLSWGVAGGLDPVLCSGTVVLASEVRANGSDAEPPWARCFSTSVAWRERLQQRLGPSALQGALLSGRELIATPAHKAQLFALTAARAVDMESAAIAAVARCHELPFMAVRAIVDGACDALPAALADRLREGGSWAPLLAVPPLWPSLLRLGVRYRRARSALRSCARRGITP